MWIFAKTGFVEVVRHPSQRDQLLIRSQDRLDLENFVGVLGEVTGEAHEVHNAADGDYRFMVSAAETAVSRTLTWLLQDIDYDRFQRSLHFDFGDDPHCVFWMSPSGVRLLKLHRAQLGKGD